MLKFYKQTRFGKGFVAMVSTRLAKRHTRTHTLTTESSLTALTQHI